MPAIVGKVVCPDRVVCVTVLPMRARFMSAGTVPDCSEALTMFIFIGANVSALSFSILVGTGHRVECTSLRGGVQDDMFDVYYCGLRKLSECVISMNTWCLIFGYCRFSTCINSAYNPRNLVNEECVETFKEGGVRHQSS